MNKEYIERETIIEQIIKMRDNFAPTVRPMFDVFKHIITEAPAADVVPIRKPTEQEKTKFKSLFAKKEKYYKLSTIYDLAFEDDVNGTCDGNVDAWLIATLTSADVESVRHGEWIEEWGQSYLVSPMKYDKDGLPILQDYISYVCSQCGRRASEKHPYCHCGAKMDRGKE